LVLAREEWGVGDNVAVLLHGTGGSSRSWWQVGPELARHGYRVLAIDLPGHGRSAPDLAATPESFVDALARAVPESAQLAIGHSMGGSVLARAVADGSITPAGAVYVEAPFATAPLIVNRDELRRRYACQKASRTDQTRDAQRQISSDL
jgi:pimeloyl-ACP methyl ester carboxylesterase